MFLSTVRQFHSKTLLQVKMSAAKTNRFFVKHPRAPIILGFTLGIVLFIGLTLIFVKNVEQHSNLTTVPGSTYSTNSELDNTATGDGDSGSSSLESLGSTTMSSDQEATDANDQPLYTPSSDFPTSRNPLLWPFLATSFWNMPVHDNATYSVAAIKTGSANVRKLSTDQDIVILDPNAPLQNVRQSTVGWGGSVNGQVRCAGVTSTVHRQLPITSGFFTVGATSEQDPVGRDGTQGNHATTILAQDGRTLYTFGPFERCVNGTADSYGEAPVAKYNPTGDDAITDIQTGVGRRGNHGGSKLSSLGGTLRVGELMPGSTINHALKINLWANANLCSKASVGGGNQYVWPAFTADGYANVPYDQGPEGKDRSYQGNNPNLCMGSLLALTPSFNTSSLQTEPARILAQALQNYGAYVVDDTARDVYGLATEWGPNGNARLDFESDWGYPIDTTDQNHPWLEDLHTIFGNLNVITNQNSNNIGGGPNSDTTNRRAPQAPKFSVATINTNNQGAAVAGLSTQKTINAKTSNKSTFIILFLVGGVSAGLLLLGKFDKKYNSNS